MKDNSPLFQAKLHRIIFLMPCLMSLFGGGLYVYFPLFKLPALAVLFVGLGWFIMTLALYQFSSLTIESHQLVLRTGFLVRQTINISLEKIESLDTRQSIIGSLLNYGNLMITGTGGTKYGIDKLAYPLTCRRHIEVLLGRRVSC